MDHRARRLSRSICSSLTSVDSVSFIKIFYLYLKLDPFYTVWINGFEIFKRTPPSNVLIIIRCDFLPNLNFNFIFQASGVLGFWGFGVLGLG